MHDDVRVGLTGELDDHQQRSEQRRRREQQAGRKKRRDVFGERRDEEDWESE